VAGPGIPLVHMFLYVTAGSTDPTKDLFFHNPVLPDLKPENNSFCSVDQFEIIDVPPYIVVRGGGGKAHPILFLSVNTFFSLVEEGHMKTYKYFLNDYLGAVKTERNEKPEFKRIFLIF
jgi:hypothetical protein